jgi:hypothetical protein
VQPAFWRQDLWKCCRRQIRHSLRDGVLILLLFTLSVNRVSAQLRISEFMASNTHTLKNEDGAFDDWIETFPTVLPGRCSVLPPCPIAATPCYSVPTVLSARGRN